MKRMYLFAFCIVTCLALNAQNALPDPLFGNNGSVRSYSTFPPTIANAVTKACFREADGKLLLVLGVDSKTRISRLLGNGSVDVSFAVNGYSPVVSLIPIAAARQTDGKVIVAGSTNGNADFMLARFNADGSIDYNFGNGGAVITTFGATPAFVGSIIVTSAGRILVAGSAPVNGKSQFVLVQYTASGILDAAFGNNGMVFTSFSNYTSSGANSIVQQPNGKILAAGAAYNTGADFAMARYNTDGSPDLSFFGVGKSTYNLGYDDAGRSVIYGSDDKIYVGGQSTDLAGHSHFSVARFYNDGTVDLTYKSGQGHHVLLLGNGSSTDHLLVIKQATDGKIIGAGHTTFFSGDFDATLVRFNTDGSIDNSFGTDGNGLAATKLPGSQEENDWLLLLPDGNIVSGGSRTASGQFNSGFTVTQHLSNGTPDAAFGTNGMVVGEMKTTAFNYYGIFHQNDGKILSYAVSSNNNQVAQLLKRFNANGTPDAGFGPGGEKQLAADAGMAFFQPDGKLVRIGYSPANNGDIMLVRYNPDGATDQSFGQAGVVYTDLGATESAACLAFQQDGKIVLGGLRRLMTGGSDLLVVRYLPNGNIDAGFGTGGSVNIDFLREDQASALAIAPDGKILVAGQGITFPPFADRIKTNAIIARLTANGTPDNSFGNMGKFVDDKSDNEFIATIVPQQDGKIVLTRFDDATATHKMFLERLTTTGLYDNSFAGNGSVACDGGSILQQPDEKLIVFGYVKNHLNNNDVSIARYDRDGNADPSFAPNGKALLNFAGTDNYMYAGVLSGENIFLAGGGVDETGLSTGVIAKLGPEVLPIYELHCPVEKTVNNDMGMCSAKVLELDPVSTPPGALINYAMSGAIMATGNGSVSGMVFNKGLTSVTYTVADDPGTTCSFPITVVDAEAPRVSNLSVSPASLWPPHHFMKDVEVNYTVQDNCENTNTTIVVTSNEVNQSSDPEDQSPDWEIIDQHHIKLRSERLGNGNGRIYTISVIAADAAGNRDTALVTVTVPKSMATGSRGITAAVTPNPATNYFQVTISAESDKKIKVRLLDNNGMVVTTISNVNPGETIRLGDGLKAGTYFLEITQGTASSTTKLIKL